MSPPLKSALRSRTTPGVSFKGNERHPVAHTAKETKVGPTAPSPVASVASVPQSSKTPYPKEGMGTIDCFKCGKMGHFARDCTYTGTKKPFVQRSKSPAPTRKPAVPSAQMAVESSQDGPSYEWDQEAPGIGYVTVQTAPVSVGFNYNNLTDSITKLPMAAHAPAISLLDDGDVESNPGPPKVNDLLLHHLARERERDFQRSRYQSSTPTYMEHDDAFSVTVASGIESGYSAGDSDAPPFTDEMVIELLETLRTAQRTLFSQDQRVRISQEEPTLYVRQMSSQETFETATSYSTHVPIELINNIAQAAVQPSVDPTYLSILQDLSSELEHSNNKEFEKIVFLSLKSMKSLLKNRGDALLFIVNTLLQAKYKELNAIDTPITLTPSQLSVETEDPPGERGM